VEFRRRCEAKKAWLELCPSAAELCWAAIRNLGVRMLRRKRRNFGEMRVMDRLVAGRFGGGWCDGSISLVPTSAMQKFIPW
jgi:hypothetical protein